MTAFEGIPFEAVDFYEDLERDNSREWWTANRERYDVAVRAPMDALAAALAEEFGPAKVFRPYRDVRFSPDKSPYKTHQGIFVMTATRIGWHVQISANGLLTAGGWYASTSDQLARYRHALDDKDTGRQLQRILDGLRESGYTVDGDRLKTRPRVAAPDHPFLDLLRHRTLTVERQYGEPKWLPTPQVLTHVRADWRAYHPLMDWLSHRVGGARA